MLPECYGDFAETENKRYTQTKKSADYICLFHREMVSAKSLNY
jgi:hypothetical protein